MVWLGIFIRVGGFLVITIVGLIFGAADETIISKKYERPVIVHHYPAAIKAFYMKRDAENPDQALAMDVLAPEGYGEIIVPCFVGLK